MLCLVLSRLPPPTDNFHFDRYLIVVPEIPHSIVHPTAKARLQEGSGGLVPFQRSPDSSPFPFGMRGTTKSSHCSPVETSALLSLGTAL